MTTAWSCRSMSTLMSVTSM
ncbi:Putative uncharacterized protein [Lactobacillus delbrueckii subsp. lactis]|nr:Putative uncharacterized protein [Lactobacillus delbrueckii subsp. lactis]